MSAQLLHHQIEGWLPKASLTNWYRARLPGSVSGAAPCLGLSGGWCASLTVKTDTPHRAPDRSHQPRPTPQPSCHRVCPLDTLSDRVSRFAKRLHDDVPCLRNRVPWSMAWVNDLPSPKAPCLPDCRKTTRFWLRPWTQTVFWTCGIFSLLQSESRTGPGEPLQSSGSRV